MRFEEMIMGKINNQIYDSLLSLKKQFFSIKNTQSNRTLKKKFFEGPEFDPKKGMKFFFTKNE